MNLNFYRKLLTLGTAVLLAANLTFAADTNTTEAITRDEMAKNYLQIQEQFHATQLAVAETMDGVSGAE